MKPSTFPKTVLLLFLHAALAAHAEVTTLGEVTVSAFTEKPKSSVSFENTALPTPVTVITLEDIRRTNVKEYTDLLRKVPGVNAYSFGQNDIGSPIKMRGFVGTGAHGGDVAIYVDGVPQNFPSAAQGGPGMSDLSWLTPEMIERIEVIKGPFSALYGDQNRAGALNIVTRSAAPSSVGATLGRFDTRRGTAVFGGQSEQAHTLAIVDLYHSDGYRDNSAIDRGNAFVKTTLPIGSGSVSIRGNYYKADWNAPGYLSYQNLVAGLVRPTDRDPNAPPLYGEAERYGVVLNHLPKGDSGFVGTAFAEHYFKMRANPGGTPTRVNVQRDDRDIYGARGLYNWQWGETGVLTVGAETRLDRGDGQNRRYENGAPTAFYSNNWGLDLLTYGVFAQGQYKLADSVKLLAGVRHDRFDYEIDNRKQPNASLDYTGNVTTPRLGLVWSATPNLDFFANVGEGFRSPAERELSPAGAIGPLGALTGASNPNIDPPKVKSRDFGFNGRFGAWRVNVSYYHTLNQNEIRETVAGSGVFAGIGDTTRDGYEFDVRYFASENLTLYAGLGHVRGRVRNPATAGQVMIGGLPEDMFLVGGDYSMPFRGGTLDLSVNAQYIEGAPYYVGAATSPLYSKAYTRYDLRASYETRPHRLTAYLILQPREYASEQAGVNIDPRPRSDFGLSYTYTF